ncbi:MAG: helix-turn-helix domain-containing protein [Actinomycetota bacterium]
MTALGSGGSGAGPALTFVRPGVLREPDERLHLGTGERIHHLVWPVRSALQVRTDQIATTVSPPFGLWIPANVAYAIETSSQMWTAGFIAESCPDGWERVANIPVAEVVAPLLIHLSRFGSRPSAPAILAAVVEQLHDALTCNPATLQLPADPRARIVADALAEDPSISWDLADWAAHVGAGERTLRRLFREQTGLSFGRWRFRLRVQTAIRLLQEGFPIGDVATSCGYRSPDAFARAFSGETGRTPSDFVPDDGRARQAPAEWPALPDRVVAPTPRVVSAFSWAELDTLLALGVKIAARGSYGEDRVPYQLAAGALQVESFVQAFPPDVGHLATLEPDIIFVSNEDGGIREVHDALSSVAPTVVLPAGDPERQVHAVAEALGIPDERIAEVLATAQASYASFVPSWTPASIMAIDYHGDDELHVWTSESSHSRALELLGLPALRALSGEPDDSAAVTVTMDRIDELDAELLLISTYSGTETDPGGPLAELFELPDFKELDVFQRGRVVVMSPELSRAMDTCSVLNAEVLTRGMEDALVEVSPA